MSMHVTDGMLFAGIALQEIVEMAYHTGLCGGVSRSGSSQIGQHQDQMDCHSVSTDCKVSVRISILLTLTHSAQK